MPTYSYIKVSHTCNIIGFIAKSTLKLIIDTKSKIFGNTIFEMTGSTFSGLIFKSYLQSTIIKDAFNDCFNYSKFVRIFNQVMEVTRQVVCFQLLE